MSTTPERKNEEFERVIGVFGIRRPPRSGQNVYYSDTDFIERHLQKLDGWYEGNIQLVSGGSSGVELIAEEWAYKNRVPFVRVKPLLYQNQINPFDIRNETIIEMSTEVLIFWDADDTQVARTIRESVKRGRKITLIPIIHKQD